jgi:signal transduction histidine kinase
MDSERFMNLPELLTVMGTTPLTKGLTLVVQRFLQAAQPFLGDLAVGACVIESPGAAPIVASVLPEGSQPSPGRDPSRLFPGFDDELVTEVPEDFEGSTLHVARVTGALDQTQRQAAEHLAKALAVMLKHARSFQRDQEQTGRLTRSQAKLIQIEKLASLGQIVAGVVHELNNPLTSIIAYSDFLKKSALARKARGLEVSDELERLRRIGEAAERILKFSRDLVAYARPTPDIPGPVLLPEVIEKATVFCEHEFGRNDIRLECLIEPLPPIRGIAGQLTQVFVNLFTNASHAMHDSGGILEVTARLADDATVLIEVADSGVGIVEEDLEQIFEPFYTTKVDGAGTGLGLSIVRDIIRQHGGALSVTRRPTGGTLFSMRLPLVAMPTSSRPPDLVT